jgi:hypothetical protein
VLLRHRAVGEDGDGQTGGLDRGEGLAGVGERAVGRLVRPEEALEDVVQLGFHVREPDGGKEVAEPAAALLAEGHAALAPGGEVTLGDLLPEGHQRRRGRHAEGG